MIFKTEEYEGNDIIIVDGMVNNLDDLLNLLSLKEFDTIAINKSANEEERKIFSDIISKVKHTFLIEDFFFNWNMDSIEEEAAIHFLHEDEEVFGSYISYEIFLSRERMINENNGRFSYRFTKPEIMSYFKKEYALDKTYPSLSYDKEVNQNKILFLDSSENCSSDIISWEAKSFLDIYIFKEITFLRLDL